MNQQDIDKIKQEMVTDEQKLKAGRGMFNYKGNDCQQIIGGWIIHNTVCVSFEEVEQVLNNAHKIIENSIKQ